MLIELPRQLDLLAQRPAIDGDLLVLIVMAILWLVGGLAKVVTAKKGPAQQARRQQEGLSSKAPAQRETWQQRLARKVREIQEAAQTERRTPEQQTHARDAATHPAGTIAIRENPKGESVMAYKRPAPQPIRKAVRQREAQEVGAAARPEISPEPPRPLEPLAVSSEPHTSRFSDASSLADHSLSDPDALKNAILHYEILGKPLALRDSTDEASRF
ncbi:MAG TPA: hypothetical protein VLI39_02095 [Sedimentisphaerales bacterium]|nr:hypothetical protein [Sedimentisphaerales bacterium]